MANRFLDTNFYKSPFVRSLKGPLKALYSYIICDCDGAGIWNIDLEIANLYIGFQVTQDEFEENFVIKSKAIEIGGGKYFFPDFIEHQYPSGLQENNKAHKNFINTLRKYGLLNDDLTIKNKAPSKPLQSPLKGGQGNGNGNGNGNGQGNGNSPKVGGLGEEQNDGDNSQMLVPRMQALWYETIPIYTKDYSKDYEALGNIYRFIKTNAGLKSVQNVEVQQKIIDTFQLIAFEVNEDNWWRVKPLKTIYGNIQEFYNRIKDKQTNGQSASTNRTKRTANGHAATPEGVQAEFTRRYGNGG